MNPIETVRKILLDELDAFHRNSADIKRARAISDMSAQAIYSIRVELENKRLELELAKSDDNVKTWMSRDFSDIKTMRN